jgi:hypothetical protein
MDGILGPLEEPIVIDEFTYNQVKGAECLGQVSVLFKNVFSSFCCDGISCS